MRALMVKRRVALPVDVVEMGRERIKNIFRNGLPVYLSMSGGKDSIVLAHLTYQLIREGEINPSQLTVNFIDEEAMHEEVIRVTRDWRKRFLKVGAEFRWWCIEVKHFNCFNSLTNDETFICWDRRVPERWVRPMPDFAVSEHPLLKVRVDTYQAFLSRVLADGITMTGVRVAESMQRLTLFREKPLDPRMQKPIYDWKDTDVWLYIQEHGLDFPETYLHLYQTGTGKRGMRLSQFFSVDTAKVLVRLGEFDHGLMDRVMRREPNAYLASLYWDSELFRGRSAQKVKRPSPSGEAAESDEVDQVDHKARVMQLLSQPRFAPYPKGSKGIPVERRNARYIRNIIQRYGGFIGDREWKTIAGILEAGDPKQRSIRSLYSSINATASKGLK